MSTSKFNCFINVLGLGMSSSLLAVSAVQHSIGIGWATFSFVCLLWSSYQITREIYL